MNRREFIKHSLYAAAALGLKFYGTPAFGSVEAGSRRGQKKFILIFLRGGVDVLSLFPPRWSGKVGEFASHPLRPYRPDSFLFTPWNPFGGRGEPEPHEALDIPGLPVLLHPSMVPLKHFLRRNDWAVLTHTGSFAPGRSHFDQMAFIESGSKAGRKYATGILARAFSTMKDPRNPIAIGEVVPKSLAGIDAALVAGAEDVFGETSFAGGRVRGFDGPNMRNRRLSLFNPQADEDARDVNCDRYCSLVKQAKGQYQLLEADLRSYQQKSGSVFRKACDFAAQLSKSDSNPPIMEISLGGWDTHQAQNPQSTASVFYRKVEDLAYGLHALYSNMNTRNTLVMVMSEFGRTVAVNGVQGTDHGAGSAVLCFGAGIDRRKVLSGGSWSGLVNKGWDFSRFETHGGNASSAALTLQHDVREVIAECLEQHLLVDLAAEHKLSDRAIRTIFEGFSAVPNKRIFV